MRRPNHGTVVAYVALFVALGGTAFAATHLAKNSVGSKQLKKNAVTTAKIKKEAVTTAKLKNGAVNGAKVADASLTGADINLGTLGTVPNALTANGQSPTKIFKVLSKGESNVPIASIAGFAMTATCEEENADVTLKSPATSASVMEAEGNGHEKSFFEYNSATSGESAEVRLDGKEEAGKGDGFGETTFSAALRTGSVVSGDIAYDFNTFGSSPAEECVVFGEVMTG
jgi:hypothetical protein